MRKNWDYADLIGSKVDPGQIGREVFGLNDWYAEGAIAQYCPVTSLQVATKPARLTHIEAASAPLYNALGRY